jgi:hypothetical protein
VKRGGDGGVPPKVSIEGKLESLGGTLPLLYFMADLGVKRLPDYFQV